MLNKIFRNKYNINVLQLISKKQNFYVFKLGNLTNEDYKALKRDLNQEKIEFYKIKSNLIKIIFKNSIFHNLTRLLEGPILIISLPSNNLLELNKIEKKLILLGYKLKNKFYSAPIVKNDLKLDSEKKIRLQHLVGFQQNLRRLIYLLKLQI